MSTAMETLNRRLVEDELFSDLETEDMLLRRLSTYATLRSGDLTALMGNGHLPHNHHHRSTRSHSRHEKHAPLSPGSFFQEPFIRERSDSESSASDQEPEVEGQEVTVQASDIGDHPIQYEVRDLRPHEMPAIGKSHHFLSTSASSH
jgi:hypothetical protein